VLGIKILKKKKFGYGMLGFAITLILISLILLLQQYARHAVFSLGTVMFDIKQYSAWILALICYLAYKRRQKVPDLQ
jgi:amino acid permease